MSQLKITSSHHAHCPHLCRREPSNGHLSLNYKQGASTFFHAQTADQMLIIRTGQDATFPLPIHYSCCCLVPLSCTVLTKWCHFHTPTAAKECTPTVRQRSAHNRDWRELFAPDTGVMVSLIRAQMSSQQSQTGELLKVDKGKGTRRWCVITNQ